MSKFILAIRFIWTAIRVVFGMAGFLAWLFFWEIPKNIIDQFFDKTTEEEES